MSFLGYTSHMMFKPSSSREFGKSEFQNDNIHGLQDPDETNSVRITLLGQKLIDSNLLQRPPSSLFASEQYCTPHINKVTNTNE